MFTFLVEIILLPMYELYPNKSIFITTYMSECIYVYNTTNVYACVYVCVRVRACVERVCVCSCLCACVYIFAHVRVYVCVLIAFTHFSFVLC